MAIPKHKAEALILALKPKGGKHDQEEEHDEEEGEGDDYESKLDGEIQSLARAIVKRSEEDIVSCLHALVDCITEADKEQDKEDKDEY